MRRVCVNVKNARSYACAGSAYDGVPAISNAPAACEYLVTIRHGPPWEFPASLVDRRSSTRVEIASWREVIVAVSAHEEKHIEQYRRRAPRSEVACECFAAEILQRYRAGTRLTLAEARAVASAIPDMSGV